MKTFKTFHVSIITIFLTFSLIFIAAVYYSSAWLNISLAALSPVFIIATMVIYLFSVSLILYFNTKGFGNKVEKEKKQTIEIIHRYEALNNATNDAVWDHDLVTGETFYNARLMKIFGYSKEDLKNNESWWLDNIHPVDKERVKKKIDTILQNIDPLWQDEYQFRCKDGTYKIVQDRSYIVRDITGTPLRLIGAMNDITTERSLQEKMVQEKLEHKNELGKAIILAHEEERKLLREELHEDVNQILASIKLCIHSINNRLGADKMVKESINQLDDVIYKIRKISNQLAPSGLAHFGLVSSIKDIKAYKESHFRVSIQLKYDAFNESGIDNTLSIFLYRVIQDYFNNAFANKASIPTMIILEIKNNENRVEINITESSSLKNINAFVAGRGITDLGNKLELYNGQLQAKLNEDGSMHIGIFLQ